MYVCAAQHDSTQWGKKLKTGSWRQAHKTSHTRHCHQPGTGQTASTTTFKSNAKQLSSKNTTPGRDHPTAAHDTHRGNVRSAVGNSPQYRPPKHHRLLSLCLSYSRLVLHAVTTTCWRPLAVGICGGQPVLSSLCTQHNMTQHSTNRHTQHNRHAQGPACAQTIPVRTAQLHLDKTLLEAYT